MATKHTGPLQVYPRQPCSQAVAVVCWRGRLVLQVPSKGSLRLLLLRSASSHTGRVLLPGCAVGQQLCLGTNLQRKHCLCLLVVLTRQQRAQLHWQRHCQACKPSYSSIVITTDADQPSPDLVWGLHLHLSWDTPKSSDHLPFVALLAQGIAEKLNQASYMTSELYTTARRFMVVFAAHFQTLLEKGALFIPPALGPHGLQFRCRNGTLIPLADVVKCLRAVNFTGQALNMACERYMCRLTPAAAATCLPAAPLVAALRICWCKLFGDESAELLLQRLQFEQQDAGAANRATYLDAVTGKSSGHAFMHST